MNESLASHPAVRSRLDIAAVALSAVCLVHCLALPLLVTLLPLFASGFVQDERFHRWMLLLILPTTTIALVSGYRRHADRRIATVGGVAVTLIVSAAFGKPLAMSENTETFLTVAGVLALSATHLWNIRAQRIVCVPLRRDGDASAI